MNGIDDMLQELRRRSLHIVRDEEPIGEPAVSLVREEDIAYVEELIEKYGWQHLRGTRKSG